MLSQSSQTPLVIIGLDGGDPQRIERWAAEGYLPAIAQLMQRGCYAQTGGPELIIEHGIWTSILSGISRFRHGYYYFRQLVPGSYSLKTVKATDFDAPPFWNHLTGSAKRVLLVDPPEAGLQPNLNGVQILNWAAYTPSDPDSFIFTTQPAALREELITRFGPPLRSPDKHQSSPKEDEKILNQLLTNAQKKGAVVRYLLAREPFDVIYTCFVETHSASHQFYKYSAAPQADERLQDAMRQVYQAVDHEIGLILAQLSENAHVVLIAPVGIEDDYPTGGLTESFLHQLGYQADPQPQSHRKKGPMDIARALIPESLRALLSRYLLSREKREAILAAQFRAGTDWARTRAFAIPSAYTSLIRVNLRGREPQGIVAPGAEYEALLDELENDLRALIDPISGQPAVRDIYRTQQIFSGDIPQDLPDLFVNWNCTHFMQQVNHPRAVLTQQKPDFFRRTDHTVHGFLAACGPAIRAGGRVEEVDILSIAPMLLRLAGCAVPETMLAKPSADILNN